MLLVGRWAGETSTFSAHIVPVIIQPVLKHVDQSRLDKITWQFILEIVDIVSFDYLLVNIR